jgi:hypothetical protein
MATVKVRATENGHDGTQYRVIGEGFEVDKARLKDGSTWFEPVPANEKAEPEPPAE